MSSRTTQILSEFRPSLAQYEELYRHFHANPELSYQEEKTATKISELLKQYDFKLHENIGGHGLVAVLENGPGKTVLLRADMDALPVEEKTGFEYASKVRMIDSTDATEKPVMHACGHDVHVTTLLAVAETLFKARAKWSGTLLCLFQPAEEKGTGARDMVKDDVYKKIGHIPDVVLGAHVSPHPAGFVGVRPGPITSNCNSFRVTVYGRGGHASMPDTTVDPVVLASHIVVRLQTIVSREVSPADMVVLTVGSIESGEAENIISDQAIIKINIRTYKKDIRDRVLAAVKRIIDAECLASGTPRPALIEPTCDLPLTLNDPECTTQLSASFKEIFGQAFNGNVDMIPGSEDFSVLATEIGKPCCFWIYGSTTPSKFHAAMAGGTASKDIAMNHSPFFAPDIEKTLPIAISSYVTAALTWL